MTSYLAVTGHWLTKEWQLRSELLSFSEIEGSHSGENLGEELYDVLIKFHIANKVHSSSISCCMSLIHMDIRCRMSRPIMLV
jgi:hypothetical protein